MPTLKIALQSASVSAAHVARTAGVRRSAVADYLARRWKKCGSENRKKIHAALIDLAVIPKPDPRALVRRRMRNFHRDAHDRALYARLTAQPAMELLVDDEYYRRRFMEVA